MTAKKTTAKKKVKKVLDDQFAAMPIIPDRPTEGIVHDARSVIEKKEPKPDLEAKALLDLSQSDGWKIVKEYLLRRGSRLLSLTREANRRKMAGGSNFSDAGFAFTIYDQIAAADEALIGYVESPTKLKAFERDADMQDDSDELDV